MTAAARKPRHTSTRYITGETFKCFDLECHIDHDLQNRDFPMFVDEQIIGYAHSATEARTLISQHCEELARQTRADTADAEAERAAETVETLRERLDANTDAAMRYPLGSTERVAAQGECLKIIAQIDALRAGEAHICTPADLGGYPGIPTGPTPELDESHCFACGDPLPAADGPTLCAACIEIGETIVIGGDPTPEQQAAHDAENEADMLDFLRSSSVPDSCFNCGGKHHIQQCPEIRVALFADYTPQEMHTSWRDMRPAFVAWLRSLTLDQLEGASHSFAQHLSERTGKRLDAQSILYIWRTEMSQAAPAETLAPAA